jgi:hypothetical protein
MTLTDQEVIDTINDVLARKNAQPSDGLRYLRANASSWPAHELKPLIDRYLRIVDPPQFCQVEHKMSCGNPMPSSKHGGR